MTLSQRTGGHLSLAVGLVATVACVLDVADVATGNHKFSAILVAVAMGLLAMTFTARGVRALRRGSSPN